MNTQPSRISLAPLILVCAGAVAVATTSAHAQPRGGPPEYEVTAIIAGFQCGDHLAAVSPWALNEAGDVAGFVTCSLVQRAFRWTAETGLELIPMPGGTTESRGLAINGSKIVGTYDNPILELGKTGFLYDFETGEFTSLGTLSGGNWSEGHGINALGQITGFWGNNVIGFWKAFIWENGEMIDIGPSLGKADSRGFGINDNGASTGWMGVGNIIDSHAFIWDDGRVTELPFIPGGFTSEGWSLNCHLDVVGQGRFFDPELDAIVWRAFAYVDGEAFRLDPLPGPSHSIAFDINNAQTVVGGSNWRAFKWKDGVLTDLNDLIGPAFDGVATVARGINQTGEIVAQAHSDDLNATVGLLLSPINQGIPGDLDNDGQVGVKDLLILLGSWGPCDNCDNCPADLNSDCVVGVDDLLILLGNWG